MAGVEEDSGDCRESEGIGDGSDMALDVSGCSECSCRIGPNSVEVKLEDRML